MEVATADVISTAVAPIVMVSAGGVLFIGIQTKKLPLADRIRDLAREYRAAGGSDGAVRRGGLPGQIALFEKRLRTSQHAREPSYLPSFCLRANAMPLP